MLQKLRESMLELPGDALQEAYRWRKLQKLPGDALQEAGMCMGDVAEA